MAASFNTRRLIQIFASFVPDYPCMATRAKFGIRGLKYGGYSLRTISLPLHLAGLLTEKLTQRNKRWAVGPLSTPACEHYLVAGN